MRSVLAIVYRADFVNVLPVGGSDQENLLSYCNTKISVYQILLGQDSVKEAILRAEGAEMFMKY